jgi:SAM-dependent methyltransferase
MAFTPLNAFLIASLRDVLPAAPTAVELGNQRFKPANADLARVIDYMTSLGRTDEAAALREFSAIPVKERIPQTHKFFEALGFGNYTAIDVNDKFGSIVMDLNKSVTRDYGHSEQYDLVINNGTGEHIFDQKMVFENMHELCKPGGYILNILPFANFLNHGFYNFHPTLFLDIAAANNYQVIAIGIGNRWGTLGFLTGALDRALIDAQEIPAELLMKPIDGRAPWGKPPLRWARLLADRFGYYDTPARRLEKSVKYVMQDSIRRENVDYGNVFSISISQKATNDTFEIPAQRRFIPQFKDKGVASSYSMISDS